MCRWVTTPIFADVDSIKFENFPGRNICNVRVAELLYYGSFNHTLERVFKLWSQQHDKKFPRRTPRVATHNTVNISYLDNFQDLFIPISIKYDFIPKPIHHGQLCGLWVVLKERFHWFTSKPKHSCWCAIHLKILESNNFCVLSDNMCSKLHAVLNLFWHVYKKPTIPTGKATVLSIIASGA